MTESLSYSIPWETEILDEQVVKCRRINNQLSSQQHINSNINPIHSFTITKKPKWAQNLKR